MEPGDHQHINSRKQQLYFHSFCRTMRNDNQYEHQRYSRYNSIFQSAGALLPRFDARHVVNNLNQRHHGIVEPVCNQHSNIGNNNLYLYTGCRPMCSRQDHGY
ncbi:hypothetical protein SDC9_79212 [bioreactor metagenome]|uniref:Uncharacterized protein n=1 Tax=bioreactor metagenome TaxID=1076179 RepID=A0A644YWC2_9ZZZZ